MIKSIKIKKKKKKKNKKKKKKVGGSVENLTSDDELTIKWWKNITVGSQQHTHKRVLKKKGNIQARKEKKHKKKKGKMLTFKTTNGFRSNTNKNSITFIVLKKTKKR